MKNSVAPVMDLFA
ncbi:hypothetical protein RLOC_00007506 [Lonchura striata]|uniref:Uncharacterized protein n=1 Tax=Lonchura striata TaxID=40157 RepID=A0A218UD40_9PASE|nr:hypothetical protein RLOC_00007506 [Lonchura striata domestica]